ncbi:MAG TPA: hypothetical protein VFZ65_01230, partial [Planctomycetota bacterium]|nr:hypothetical protein [Planctomycetota bacterium]
LGKATHSLVAASKVGTFPPLVRVGAIWFVKASDVRAWFDRNHAAPAVTEAQRERIRQAGQPERAAWLKPRRTRRGGS